MAISPTDWSSTSDPFRESIDYTPSGYNDYLTASGFLEITGVNGFFTNIGGSDAQECYWVKTTDTTRVLDSSTVIAWGEHKLNELGRWDEYDGSSWVQKSAQKIHNHNIDGFSEVRLYIEGKSSGSVTYELYAYLVPCWFEKDPAQILFSWLAHYTRTRGMYTAKDYLNEDSFMDASDYYDNNPCRLDCHIEIGSTLAQQIKKLFKHTADIITIRPDRTSAGETELHILPRRELNDVTTPIDITSDSISEYTIRLTDKYRLSGLNAGYCDTFRYGGSGSFDPANYDDTFPYNLPGNFRSRSLQRAHGFGNSQLGEIYTADLQYHTYRTDLLAHLDIGYWKELQYEIFISFADWSHFNFEAGDIVHITGGGLNGDENFLVYEKKLDVDNFTATVRLLQVHGLNGKTPRMVDYDNQLIALRPNGLNAMLDGAEVIPTLHTNTFKSTYAPNLDRYISEGEEYDEHLAAWEFDRGNRAYGGNPYTPSVDLDSVNGWPTLEEITTPVMGLQLNSRSGHYGFDGTGFSTTNLTFIFVGNCTSSASNQGTVLSFDDGTNQLHFAPFGGNTAGKVQYYDGTWRGSINCSTGWQIVVFVLDTTGAYIRRNGVTIESGLSFTARGYNTDSGGDDGGILGAADGNSPGFIGTFGELHLFNVALSLSDIQDIEEHLAEKFAITI